LSRPDKLRAHRVGGYADVALFFDGKTVSVFGKHISGYAQFDAPGSVDQLIAALRAGHGIALPGADLLLSNVGFQQYGTPPVQNHGTPGPGPSRDGVPA
jgi:hypothetical protein